MSRGSVKVGEGAGKPKGIRAGVSCTCLFEVADPSDLIGQCRRGSRRLKGNL